MYYFDNSATTIPDDSILETYCQVATTYFANPSSAHRLGVQCHQLLEASRKQVAEILHCGTDEIYFTSSGTEANNIILQGIVRELNHRDKRRKHILVSAVEHPATMRQIHYLESQGYHVEIIPVDSEGQIKLDHLIQMIKPETLLISIMAVNNEVGAVQPLGEIGKILEGYPQIAWHVDAVQSVTTHLQLLQNRRIDLMTLSSHKFHSVRGVGILLKRYHIPAGTIIWGGGQERQLRSGTENLPAIVATSKALRIACESQQETRSRLRSYRQQIVKLLESCGWSTFSHTDTADHIICAALPGVPGEVILHAFEDKNIYISTTSACSSRSHQDHSTLKAMGIPSSLRQSAVRFSMGRTTNQEEVDYLCVTIEAITKALTIH